MSFESKYNEEVAALKKKYISSIPKSKKVNIDSEEKKAFAEYIRKVYYQELFEADVVSDKRENLQELKQKYSSF